MVRFLVSHGVKARQQLIATGGRTIAETLVERALEIGADLMVSGCFGHGRLREWILGGATRSLLHDHRLNRLLTN
jgi:nucleotide-binding universal stress UspA family protein